MEWLSDGACKASLELEELRDPAPASPVGGAGRIRFESFRNRSPITSLEPQIWVCPASNAYADAGSLLLRSEVDPGSPSQCSRFFDVREGLPDLLPASTPVSRPYLWARTLPGVLTHYSPSRRNAGKPGVAYCSYALSTYETPAGGPPPALAVQPLWSASGWTAVLNLTPIGLSGNPAFRVVSGATTAISLNFFPSPQLQVFNASTGTTLSATLTAGASSAETAFGTFTIVLRFDPSIGRFYCHVNGQNAISGPGYLTVGSLLAASTWQVFLGLAAGFGAPGVPPHLGFPGFGNLNCFLSWNRALAALDIDLVGRDVSEAFASDWLTPTYP